MKELATHFRCNAGGIGDSRFQPFSYSIVFGNLQFIGSAGYRALIIEYMFYIVKQLTKIETNIQTISAEIRGEKKTKALDSWCKSFFW